MVRIAIAVLFMVLTPAWAGAQGGPPLLTDDPGTPGDSHWEINIALTVEKRKTETLYETPRLDINYGLGERHQLKFEIPWVVRDEKGEGTRNGLGNSLVGWKWRFLDEKEVGFSASIYPQIELNNPGSSSADRGIVSKGAEFLMPVQLAKGFGPIGANVELGYAFKEHGDDEWLYGLALSYEVSHRLELLGEIHGTGPIDFKEQELVLNLGMRWKLSTNCNLLASAGRSVPGLEDDEPQFLSYLGIQLLF